MTRDQEYGVAPPGFRLPHGTRVGTVRLQVSDADRSVAYYREVLGLVAEAKGSGTVRLLVPGEATPLLELHERRGTHPLDGRNTLGLYHFAILLPTRTALGAFIAHLVKRGERFAAADHLVSEATYLWDPDGLGIEVYADRPTQEWRSREGELLMTTDRLNVRDLASAGGAQPWEGMPSGTTMGHMHLSVGDLDLARQFYHLALGLDVTVWSYPGALFMSAGGYHHHLGTNVWAAGARTPREDDAQLLEWELRVPHASDVAAAERSLRAGGYDAHEGLVRDPWGITLRIVPEGKDTNGAFVSC
jgi:catechol 2,3-dioxygenase